MARFALRLLLIALGLSLGAAALYVTLPAAWRMRDRDRFLHSKDDCQVLLIGPSYVNKLVPEAFDDEAKRIGFGKRSCKLGRANLRGYELKRELDLVLSHGFPKLEIVAIDITLGDTLSFDPDNWFKPRLIAWHTLEAIPWLARFYGGGRSRMPSRTWVLAHAGHVVAHYLSLGRARELFGDGREPGRAERQQGAQAEEPEVKKESAERSHDKKLADLIRRKREISSRPHKDKGRWGEELRTVTRRHGVDAFFFYSPVWHGVRAVREKRRDALVLFDFNNPERYPELYTPDVRGSTEHLNTPGAKIHSRLLARAIKKRWMERWVKRGTKRQ